MPDVKRNALLPKGDENGLAAIAANLVAEAVGAEPARLRAVIAIVDAKRVTIDAGLHEEVVTVRFRRVEVLLADDLGQAEKLIRRALEHRSGETTLPLEMEDEIRQAFEDMRDPGSTDDPDEGKGGGKK